jgi:V/A-type H+-transporting ATPase subunit D
MAEVIATRSAYLELVEDRRSMQEGYRFLDEKRLVLAGALLEELGRYDTARGQLDQLYREAATALGAALQRHGLEGLQLYPAADCARAEFESEWRNVLGVALLQIRVLADPGQPEPASHPSPEAERCRQLFQEVSRQAATVAALSGNLQRLWREYSRTSRRARALEDVLIPEVSADLRMVDASLEEQDREEAIRVRYFQGSIRD